MVLGESVLNNLKTVILSGDMSKLKNCAYTHLNLYCGFIAHYDLNGFIATYRNPGDFAQFLRYLYNQLDEQMTIYLPNKSSFLYDSKSYEDIPLAQVQTKLYDFLTPIIDGLVNKYTCTWLVQERERLKARLGAIEQKLRKT